MGHNQAVRPASSVDDDGHAAVAGVQCCPISRRQDRTVDADRRAGNRHCRCSDGPPSPLTFQPNNDATNTNVSQAHSALCSPCCRFRQLSRHKHNAAVTVQVDRLVRNVANTATLHTLGKRACHAWRCRHQAERCATPRHQLRAHVRETQAGSRLPHRSGPEAGATVAHLGDQRGAPTSHSGLASYSACLLGRKARVTKGAVSDTLDPR